MRDSGVRRGPTVAVTMVALSALGALVVTSVGLAAERLGCRDMLEDRSRRTGLRASAGDLRRENLAAKRDGLSRLRDARTVARFVRARLLVPIPERTDTYYVAGVAPALRVARPWTKRFIEDLAAAYHRRARARLRITSLTRTTRHQGALRLTNVNAAPALGRVRSTHLTGASVDISKRGVSERDVAWLRAVLDGLRRRQRVHAVEELRQPHFHVMVRRSYARLEASSRRDGC